MGEDEQADLDLEALQAAGADRDAVFGELLERHRLRLMRMVNLRMHPGMKARAGASDVLQDAYVEAAERIEEYLKDPKLPFFLWLRIITAQRLIRLQRRHLGAKKRDVRRQVPIAGGMPGATSVALANDLIARGTTPTQAIARDELKAYLMTAIDAMKPEDRDILVLRHFEELTNHEAAVELGIEPPAASKRYVRALRRLHEVLSSIPGAEGDASAE
ncbi:MAG: sigma-70 family RNA polymerase sigma factor [Planctomycetota bacterium]|nr:sigma-70 family RNA polymerase sigma factor [Planctomycetota bacterium]